MKIKIKPQKQKKRKPTEYNLFVKKHRKNGKTFKEISELWNAPIIINRNKEENRIQKIVNEEMNQIKIITVRTNKFLFSIKEKIMN